jgi:serine/threonine protein kinase
MDYVPGKRIATNPHFMRAFLAEIPASYDKPLRNIIKRLLNPDPKKRPKADELLKKNKVKKYHNLSQYKLTKEKSIGEFEEVSLKSVASSTNNTNS